METTGSSWPSNLLRTWASDRQGGSGVQTDHRRGAAGFALIAAFLAVVFLLEAVTARSQANATWMRIQEPVVLAGSQLPQFAGADIHDLFAYSYSGSDWTQIPLQVDEVDASGVYTDENGFLDGNDELVFMAMDLGQAAGPSDWIDDPDSQGYVRYEVRVTNPLAPAEQGWVYLYRSATLSVVHPDYVQWDALNNRMVAGTYVAGVAPDVLVGIDSLYLNGSPTDALDRTKVRISGNCYVFGFPVPFSFTEEDLVEFLGVTPGRDGPVRAGGGTTENHIWSYYALYSAKTSANLDDLEIPGCNPLVIDEVRESFDWRDPSVSGMAPATYYDQNVAGGVAINGVPDPVPEQPFSEYQEVSGAQGTMVQVLEVSVSSGTVETYYQDTAAGVPGDTGDMKNYGDAGFLIQSPSGQVSFALSTFLLDPALPNVGETYRAYLANPLQVTLEAQTYVPPCVPPSGLGFAWTPLPVLVGSDTTFTAAVAAGDPPLAFEWLFADDGSSPSGNPVAHTFLQAGTFAVTAYVANGCGQQSVTEMVDVLASCEPVSGADFVWLPADPEVSVPTTFFASAPGTEPIGYAWDLGDGTPAEGPAPVHAYAAPGDYTVVLTATNCFGDGQEVVSHVVTVTCEPVTGTAFSWLPLVPEAGRPVAFSAQASGSDPLEFTWDLGDGTAAQGASVQHTYSEAGSYTVILTAENPCGQETVEEGLVVIPAVLRWIYLPLVTRGYH